MQTSYANRCSILGEIWLNNRNDENLEDFIEYNDLGLPLAYFISEGIVSSSPQAEQYVNETFDILMSALDLVDTGFETFDEVMTAEPSKKP